MNMYFLALVAPDEINQQVFKWKTFMQEHYGCLAAMKSPAHITLVAPFWMTDSREMTLVTAMNDFSVAQNTVSIDLHNFSCFKPGVIFLDVTPNQNLQLLQSQLLSFLIALDNFPITKESRPFHPHLTIATRDLRKKDFDEAWKTFKDRTYNGGWLAEGISLLRHNKKNWDVIFTSQLNAV